MIWHDSNNRSRAGRVTRQRRSPGYTRVVSGRMTTVGVLDGQAGGFRAALAGDARFLAELGIEIVRPAQAERDHAVHPVIQNVFCW